MGSVEVMMAVVGRIEAQRRKQYRVQEEGRERRKIIIIATPLLLPHRWEEHLFLHLLPTSQYPKGDPLKPPQG